MTTQTDTAHSPMSDSHMSTLIRVPDHLIVGGRQIFSFAEHGLL